MLQLAIVRAAETAVLGVLVLPLAQFVVALAYHRRQPVDLLTQVPDRRQVLSKLMADALHLTELVLHQLHLFLFPSK